MRLHRQQRHGHASLVELFLRVGGDVVEEPVRSECNGASSAVVVVIVVVVVVLERAGATRGMFRLRVAFLRAIAKHRHHWPHKGLVAVRVAQHALHELVARRRLGELAW